MYGNTQRFYGWATSTTATTSTDSTYYTFADYNYTINYPMWKLEEKEPEPEPCTDEELEEFLFGGT